MKRFLLSAAAVLTLSFATSGCQMIKYIQAGDYKTPTEKMEVSDEPTGFGVMIDYVKAGEYKTEISH